jgi:hypothetical protein
VFGRFVRPVFFRVILATFGAAEKFFQVRFSFGISAQWVRKAEKGEGRQDD